MIVAAATEQEHDVIVAKIMERAEKHNVKFNPDKIQFKVNNVHFMGHVITPQGVKADDGKIQAVVSMPAPMDRQALQRLLGMIRYLAPFIRGEASLTVPLRQLLRKDIAFQWQSEHDETLCALKTALTNTPVLRYYEPNTALTIQTDASKDGLGSCLLQEGQPIAYASRALTDTEKNYAQIEKELLAIVFSTIKFHQYVYGRSVNVQSDHKPLEAIFKKPLSKAPARLQRMLLQLQKYDLIVQYTPGKDMLIADTLSRAVTEGQQTSTDDLSDEQVVYSYICNRGS
ncbi:Retrovirus-related Pol polyprotein from transposon 17.6 [Labeo rohita]|uniref:Retrovirus-related Pol polyprotein from transposon 17.6 n=1 Tax=Labeo rohita TaxID=84645 RepID=A0ABQ8L7F6_LABRO|nr:Retrovirus-related Pol polyprotein from transposon 17.6 [Labeo rohita]